MVPLATLAARASCGPRRARERECDAAAGDPQLTTGSPARSCTGAGLACMARPVATSPPAQCPLPRPPFRVPPDRGPRTASPYLYENRLPQKSRPNEPLSTRTGHNPYGSLATRPASRGPLSRAPPAGEDTSDCPIRLSVFGWWNAHPTLSFHRMPYGVRCLCAPPSRLAGRRRPAQADEAPAACVSGPLEIGGRNPRSRR